MPVVATPAVQGVGDCLRRGKREVVANEPFDVAIRRLDGGQQIVDSNGEVGVALCRRGAGLAKAEGGVSQVWWEERWRERRCQNDRLICSFCLVFEVTGSDGVSWVTGH